MDYKEFYEKHAATGELPAIGLCNCLRKKDMKRISPTANDMRELISEGACPTFWGSGYPMKEWNNHKEMYEFTPLRQTLVLLLAAYYEQL